MPQGPSSFKNTWGTHTAHTFHAWPCPSVLAISSHNVQFLHLTGLLLFLMPHHPSVSSKGVSLLKLPSSPSRLLHLTLGMCVQRALGRAVRLSCSSEATAFVKLCFRLPCLLQLTVVSVFPQVGVLDSYEEGRVCVHGSVLKHGPATAEVRVKKQNPSSFCCMRMEILTFRIAVLRASKHW